MRFSFSRIISKPDNVKKFKEFRISPKIPSESIIFSLCDTEKGFRIRTRIGNEETSSSVSSEIVFLHYLNPRLDIHHLVKIY